MSITRIGVKAHDDACNTSEMVRQVAVAAAGNQAAIKAAELVHYRKCRASAIASGLSPHQYIVALQEPDY